MSEEKKLRSLQDILDNSPENLVDISEYSYIRPMFDHEVSPHEMLNDKQKQYNRLSIKQKYKKYLEENTRKNRRQYGNKNIEIKIVSSHTIFSLSMVSEFVSNDFFLLDTVESNSYFEGIGNLLVHLTKPFLDIFLYDILEQLQTFDKQTDDTVDIEKNFQKYYDERITLYKRIVEEKNILNDSYNKNLLRALLIRLEDNHKELLAEKGFTAAAI